MRKSNTSRGSSRDKSYSDKTSEGFDKKKSSFSSKEKSFSTEKPRFAKTGGTKSSSNSYKTKPFGKTTTSKYNSDEKRSSFGGDFKKKTFGDSRETGYKKPYDASKSRYNSDEKKSNFGGDLKKKTFGDSRETGYKKPYDASKSRYNSDDKKSNFGGDFKKKTFGDSRESGYKKPYDASKSRYNSDEKKSNFGGDFKKKTFGDSRETGYKKPYDASKNRYNSDDKKSNFGGDFKKKTFGESRETGYKKPYDASKSRYNSDDKKSNFGGDFKKKTFGDSRETGYKKPYDASKSRYNSDDKKSNFSGDFKKKTFGDSRETGYKRPYDASKSRYNSDEKKTPFGGGFKKKPFGSYENKETGYKKPFGSSFGDRREKRPRIGTKVTPRGEQKERQEKPDYDFSKYEKKSSFGKKKVETEETKSVDIRLNRFIANAGVCSRREADNLITRGLVRVNGAVVSEMGYQVKPNDLVEYEGKILSREKMIYVLLNKPKNTITTTEDPEERRTVMDLVENACEERIYPIGRLDRNTMGLLLLTNDGELAKKLSHPSSNIHKVYQVTLDKTLTDAHFEQLAEGIELEDGFIKPDEIAMVDNETIGIEIHSGKNRIVRRMFEHLGYEVVKLDRTLYAGLNKKNLPRGDWRYLSEREVITLKYFL